VIRGAAHVGGVIVVDDAARVREVLVPIYRALELEWRPATAGAVADVVAGVTADSVRDALVAELSDRYAPHAARFDRDTLTRADELVAWHEPDPAGGRGSARPIGRKTVSLEPDAG
jgi:hypothetical protein